VHAAGLEVPGGNLAGSPPGATRSRPTPENTRERCHFGGRPDCGWRPRSPVKWRPYPSASPGLSCKVAPRFSVVWCPETRFNIDASTADEALARRDVQELLSKPMQVRRAWSVIGLLWELLLQRLEEGTRFKACNSCGGPFRESSPRSTAVQRMTSSAIGTGAPTTNGSRAVDPRPPESRILGRRVVTRRVRHAIQKCAPSCP
jgi:hypothetical protein